MPQSSVAQGSKRLGFLACGVSIKGYKFYSSAWIQISFQPYSPSTRLLLPPVAARTVVAVHLYMLLRACHWRHCRLQNCQDYVETQLPPLRPVQRHPPGERWPAVLLYAAEMAHSSCGETGAKFKVSVGTSRPKSP